MKNLLKSLLFVIIALFAADRIGGQIMWWVNQHTRDITGPKLRYLADEADTDVILLGTSRCNFHYVPSILSDSIDMSVYNGGVDGSDCIYSHYFLLNQILTHHTPKIIGLEVSTNDYEVSPEPFKKTSYFAPYFGRSERADSVYRDAGTYWAYRLCHLYRYNAKAVSNLAGLLVNRQQGEDAGYNPLPQPGSVPSDLIKADTPESVDELKLQYVRRFITLCKDRNITLVFMVSPSYTEAGTGLYGPLKQLAEENGIPFFDYHTKGLFYNHPEYFRDNGHMWDKGARLYTSIFAHDLKQYLHACSAGV